MKELIPASWRQAASRLRDDIYAALERWRPGHQAESRAEAIPIRREPRWAPVPFAVHGPVLDIEETDDELTVEAELPGLAPEDFTGELTGERLVIRGGTQRSSKKRQRGYVYFERSQGAFVRSMALPCEVDPDRAEARYRHGVLRLTLPKTDRARSARRKIAIRS